MIKRTFKDHLVCWVEKYIGAYQENASAILADIDRQ